MKLEELSRQYRNEIDVLIHKGRLFDDWSNVLKHCKTEAFAAHILAVALKLNFEDGHDLVRAAFLHDWFKRNEREAANKEGHQAYNDAVPKSSAGLMEMGYPRRVVILTESVGHTSIKSVSESQDFIRRVMHYLDNITLNDTIVPLDERMDALEAAPRYKELNESGRAVFNGKTYFEMQRALSKEIEREIEEKIGEPVVPMLQREMAK